ncbi:hypothetical protein ETB97_008282 [Aspergillus alliaceus]|uniref:RING-type domain-containing protein n=1 Tax=Petromyces alliaceus TaxID=209559 RepID=A0A8H6E1H1_PETAA|nr:hypothetical protein ETB97_008282 [Aspergillus burnettii]
MPSPYSQPQTTSLPHLSEIVKLYPEEEPWCAGYAPSQGRRCHASTNARNRKTAMYLLDEGTKGLHAGRDINNLLEDLAPYVLCTRSHQDQASELAAKWKRQVQRFLGSCMLPAPSQRAAGERQRISSLERSGRSVDVESFYLEKWLQVLIGEPERLRTTRLAPAASRQRLVNERVTQTADRPSELSMSSALPTQQITIRTRAVAYSRAGLQVASAAASNRGLSNIPTAAIRATSNPVLPGSGSRTTRSSTTSSCSGDTTRRPIEGDCSICFDPLKKARTGTGDGTRHDTEDKEEQQELSWCKAQCGVNYHTSCIELWLKASTKSTCPTCRSAWRY